MASEDSYTTVSENSTTDTSILSVESEDTDNGTNLSIDGSDEPAISVSSYDSSDEDTTHETGYITSNQRNSSMSDMSVDWDTTNSSIEAPDNTREYIIAHLSNLDSFCSIPNIIARNTRLQTARYTNLVRSVQQIWYAPYQIRACVGQSSEHKKKAKSPPLSASDLVRSVPNSRERSWSLEECSICFDVILKDQEVLSLPCTHQFHAACIMPWLEQKQTCPNCRKSVD